MSPFQAAIDKIKIAATRPALPLAERSAVLSAAIAAMDGASPEELDHALQQLAPSLNAADPYCGGIVSMAMGALLESGATPGLASAPLREALTKKMREASQFAETWKQGEPPESDAEPIEAFDAVVNGQSVDPSELQWWAARDPANARAWSRMDDWFLPMMALSRTDEQCRREVINDGELRQAYGQLKEADPSMFYFAGLGNSSAGTHFEKLMTESTLPTFADEVSEPTELHGPAKLLNDMAEQLYAYCDQPDVVVVVEMDFTQDAPSIRVIRHIRDPGNLFDRSKDPLVSLPKAGLRELESLVDQFAASAASFASGHTTLSVYANGTWSVGSRSRRRS
ncbi:MAG: hypothetical protein P4L99_09115 [Chthoniobacter sp.]|nr:hypothetical protein [Chthoniobacter sp.]